MATMKTTILTIFLAFLSLCSSLTFTNANLNLWCTHTPYPEACKKSMSNSHVLLYPDFKKMMIQVALEDSIRARIQTDSLGSKCKNAKEEAAWDDCVELYGHSIHELNKTLIRYNSCTDSDKQTWISTALTYLENCRNGFIDLNVTDNVLSLIETDASKLISNALVVNKVEKPEEQSSEDGFPTWVSAGDRKLLESKSKSTMAHLVVAKNGSGHYRSIQTAVNAAATLKKRSGRLVIYVKKGVYEENVVIGSNLPHLMLVGDGLNYTIITGSKSVGGGSTTFKSATLGK